MRTTLLIILFFFCTAAIAQQKKHDFSIKHIAGDTYVYTTYGDYDGTPVPSNSVFVVTTAGIAMIDVPWDTTKTSIICDSIERRFHKKIVFCISTHFHKDRTAGLDILEARGIATWSGKQTWELCKSNNEQQASHYFKSDTAFILGNHILQTFYAGPGHTADNIVVWVKKDKVLDGACFIKSDEAKDLGYTGDANIPEWPRSVNKVIAKFGNAAWVIPGHGRWTAGNKLLYYTLQLTKK